MAAFVQIIEFTTSRIDEVRAIGDRFREERMTAGAQTPPAWIVMTADRDRPNTYLNIVQFPSYEQAMANSNDPATTEFARQLAELCDAPPRFYNLDVLTSWASIEAQQRQPESGGAVV